MQDLFGARAATDPDLPAIICNDSILSYGELARIANALSVQLRAFGSGPKVPVAVAMESGWEQVAAMLGIMLAGSPVVAIDIGPHRERLGHLLDAASVDLVVTQPSLRKQLDLGHGRRIFQVLRADHPDAAKGCLPGPREARSGRAVAALVYDFDSATAAGHKVGHVEVGHPQALAAVRKLRTLLDLGAEDKVTVAMPFASKAFLYCAFAALAAGATIVIPASREARDPRLLFDLISDYGVTVFCSPPGTTDALCELSTTGPLFALATVRLVLVVGDWIPVRLLARLRRNVPGIGVLAMRGGHTPAGDAPHIASPRSVQPLATSIVSLWEPDNLRVQVLSKDMAQCPEFATGEIYLGGAGPRPNRWHWTGENDHDLLLQPSTGERLYPTGQRGRLLPDGIVELKLPTSSDDRAFRLL